MDRFYRSIRPGLTGFLAGFRAQSHNLPSTNTLRYLLCPELVDLARYQYFITHGVGSPEPRWSLLALCQTVYSLF
jgi:hypothetical protein